MQPQKEIKELFNKIKSEYYSTCLFRKRTVFFWLIRKQLHVISRKDIYTFFSAVSLLWSLFSKFFFLRMKKIYENDTKNKLNILTYKNVTLSCWLLGGRCGGRAPFFEYGGGGILACLSIMSTITLKNRPHFLHKIQSTVKQTKTWAN